MRPILSPFLLVDLTSQVEFIPLELRRYAENFLAWLKLFGELEPLEIDHAWSDMPEQWYTFYSRWGPQTMFRLTQEGTLVTFLGDHALLHAWSATESGGLSGRGD